MATNGFSWNPYQAPAMTQDQYQFFRPANSQMPTGQAQLSYLTPGTDSQETRRTVKYDGGLTREMIGNSTGFLDGQLRTGFEGLNTTLNNFGGLGGLGGMQGGSPVYRPNGAAVGQGATNGQPLPWGLANPFNQTF